MIKSNDCRRALNVLETFLSVSGPRSLKCMPHLRELWASCMLQPTHSTHSAFLSHSVSLAVQPNSGDLSKCHCLSTLDIADSMAQSKQYTCTTMPR